MKKLLILFILIGAAALAAAAQTDIRKVDFKNFTYEVPSSSGEGTERLTLTDGNYSRMEEDDRLYFAVMEVEYGDLTGDGREEAIVTTVLNTGGTGNFTNGLVFSMRAGKPFVLTEFEGGDRAYGGIVSAKVAAGALVVERNAPGPLGGACCAEFIETSRYKWNGAKLVQFGKTESRPLYPAERVAFKKGTSLAIIRVRLEKYDRKRFVVGARAGQTLAVSSGFEPSNALAYELRRGDGEVETTPMGLLAKLKENGDYVIEIANTTENDIEFSITIEIR